jgi:hypothetical protein
MPARTGSAAAVPFAEGKLRNRACSSVKRRTSSGRDARVTTGASASAPEPQRLTAILTIRGNGPITVNGANAITGATILTGATIETPDQVSAVIDLGDAGVVELQANSQIKLDFDANGNVRVKQIKGCAVVRRKANVLPNATWKSTRTRLLKRRTRKKNIGFAYCRTVLDAVGANGRCDGRRS